MSDTPFMKLWVDDFLSATTHLNATETGAYMLLLMAMWQRGGTLPADDDFLRRVARLTGRQWAKARPTLMTFFDTAPNGEIYQERLVEELAAVRRYSEGQARNARSRWRREEPPITDADEAISASDVTSLAPSLSEKLSEINDRAMPSQCRGNASTQYRESHTQDSSLHDSAREEIDIVQLAMALPFELPGGWFTRDSQQALEGWREGLGLPISAIADTLTREAERFREPAKYLTAYTPTMAKLARRRQSARTTDAKRTNHHVATRVPHRRGPAGADG